MRGRRLRRRIRHAGSARFPRAQVTVWRRPTSGRTRFSMLETIRQFAEEQLVPPVRPTTPADTHARYFAGRETDILALWDGPRQREAYSWVAAELANLRAAFRWAADHRDLDTAAAIAHYAAFLGFWGEQHEPIGWAEELIEPAGRRAPTASSALRAPASVTRSAGRGCRPIRRGRAGRYRERAIRRSPIRVRSQRPAVVQHGGQPDDGSSVPQMIARRPGLISFSPGCLVWR